MASIETKTVTVSVLTLACLVCGMPSALGANCQLPLRILTEVEAFDRQVSLVPLPSEGRLENYNLMRDLVMKNLMGMLGNDPRDREIVTRQFAQSAGDNQLKKKLAEEDSSGKTERTATLQKMLGPRPSFQTHYETPEARAADFYDYLISDFIWLEKKGIVARANAVKDQHGVTQFINKEEMPGDIGRAYRLMEVISRQTDQAGRGPELEGAYMKFAHEMLTPDLIRQIHADKPLRDKLVLHLAVLSEGHSPLFSPLYEIVRPHFTPEELRPAWN